MTEKNNNFVLLSIVAIVAIVGLVVLMRVPRTTSTTPTLLEKAQNVGGQAAIATPQMGSYYTGEYTPLEGGTVSCYCWNSVYYFYKEVSCKSIAECDYRCSKACGWSELRSYTIIKGEIK